MITLAEAEHIATGWAHRQSLRRGYACTPHVDELSLGFAVWMQLPAGVRTEPGEDVTTIIDRETGRLSHWPPASPTELDQRYRERRPAVVTAHQTANPEAELRREAHRRVSPSVAAHLTIGDRLFRARGAKGDDADPTHHPLVAHWLNDIPPGELIRGAERHAELLVLSDVFAEADRARLAAGQGLLTLPEARDLMAHGQFETFHIRERGDVIGGAPARPCDTCHDVLTLLAVRPGPPTTMRTASRWPGDDDERPARFSPYVTRQLWLGGFAPANREQEEPNRRRKMALIEACAGLEFSMTRFPAADEAFAEFFGTSPVCDGVGLAQRVRPFRIGRANITDLADPLHELGTIIGARLFPLGVEGQDEAVLAIDEHGRVFSLDQGGEWFIADTVDDALVALITGAPAARIGDDGTW